MLVPDLGLSPNKLLCAKLGLAPTKLLGCGVSVDGGVVGGVWGGTSMMAIFPIWMVGGGVFVEREFIDSALILGTCVVGGKGG